MSGVTIMLDRSAVESLFPEGSQARLELTRATMTTIIGQLTLKETKAVSEELKFHVQKIVRDVMIEQGIAEEAYRQHVTLSEKAKAGIKIAAMEAYSDAIRTETYAVLQETHGRVEKIVTSVIEHHTERGLGALVRRTLQDTLGKIA